MEHTLHDDRISVLDANLTIDENWYDDWFWHARGEDLELNAKVQDSGSVTVRLGKRRAPSGIDLSLNIGTRATEKGAVTASARWSIDRVGFPGNMVRSGLVEGLNGVVCVDLRKWADQKKLRCKFLLSGVVGTGTRWPQLTAIAGGFEVTLAGAE